jgi:hypothetical protein
MNRKLRISGAEVPAYDVAITLKVKTKCPSKWKLIDMETGEEYRGQLPTENDTHHWKKLQ